MSIKIINDMSEKNKPSGKPQNSTDFITDFSRLLVANGLPAFGTKEFNDLCSNFFGGNQKSSKNKK